ncbi:MAG: glyoxylate/hydroxypyruvate reductase A [Quisquiliibacterium sp.]
MKIVIAHPDDNANALWCQDLSQRLPKAQVRSWPVDWSEADYAIAWKPAADFFQKLSIGRALFCAGAGVDHLLRLPGLPAQLPVVRVEDAGMGIQMVHYCLLEALRVYRRDDDYARQQRQRHWHDFDYDPPSAFTVGVFGIGALGAQVAQALRGLGFTVIGYSRSQRTLEGVECYSGTDGLSAFLARCRMLVLLAPHTPDTENFFDQARLAMLPRGAWLVNAARGALVVDNDLLDALDCGALAGASLDVFHTEPLPKQHRFWTHPQVRITPHCAAATVLEETASQIAGKIAQLERGEPVSGLIDRQRGY